MFSTIVDTTTMMVMHVYTGEGPVTYASYKNDNDDAEDYGAMEWDYS